MADSNGTTMSKKSRSFQKKLFIQFSIAGFAFAIIAAFAYAYMASNTIKDLYQREGLQAAENFARLSELALLYDSGENAHEAAQATLDFPSVKHVAIINREQQILLDEGETNEKILANLEANEWQGQGAKFFAINQGTWQIASPVFTSYSEANDEEILIDDELPSDEYLGYVAIQIDTKELEDFQNKTFIRNLLIGLAYGLAFVIVLNLTLARVLKPINALTNVMAESTEGAYKNVEIEPDSASEIVKIADVYNQMISKLAERDQRLRSQKDLLETEVALRTSELVHARDNALEANRHKSEFLANITHELRTPLQSIIGYSEVISELLEDEGIFECEEDVNKISRNAEHLLGLINSILDISKIEAGKMEVSYNKINIKKLMLRASDTIKPLVEKNHNELELDIESLEDLVVTDETKLFQILLNLLSNAAKFTQNGKIKLSASIHNQNLQIDIEDNGIGISEEQQRIIFEPFRQIDGSETREFVGTGLGLSITMKFAKLMNGNVSLTSETGKGSHFTVKLPCPEDCVSRDDKAASA